MDYDTASEFSDASAFHGAYTCMTCKIEFRNAEAQREHHKEDWHKYNLKRKIAGLQPITAELFNEKILAQQQEIAEQEKIKATTWNCEACKKVFNTENALKNHELSKKHIELLAKFESKKNESPTETKENNEPTTPKINWKKKIAEAETEEEVNKIIEEKIKSSRKIEENECLFCNFKGNSFDEKMEHMTVEHTFFIPDVEYLVDLKGLINYLSEKIAIGNTCIYCEKTYYSLEAIRKHMSDKGHTKISYEEGPDLEIGYYYDFSSTYEDGVNPDEPVDPNENALTVTSEGTELILPSGAHIGHRDYKRYYNQNIRDKDESKAIVTLTQKYQALGYYNTGSSGMTIEKERLEKMKNAREELKKYIKYKEKMGYKHNDDHVTYGRRGAFERVFIR